MHLLLSACFFCVAERILEFEFEQRKNIQFFVKFEKSGNEIRKMLLQVHRDNSMKKKAV
jgi:hypothetical protein